MAYNSYTVDENKVTKDKPMVLDEKKQIELAQALKKDNIEKK